MNALARDCISTAIHAWRSPPCWGSSCSRSFCSARLSSLCTVATGTLVGAPLRTGQAVEVHPTGLRSRIRGLQSHGEIVDEASPGMRTAVNLQGIDVAQLARGEVISLVDVVPHSHAFDAKLHWLASAPAADDAREPG